MRNETRVLFNEYLANQAELNGVDPAVLIGGKTFTVEPEIQQKLITKQQESSAFLTAINVVTVDEMAGAVLGLGVSGPLARRTNTAIGTKRPTTDPTALDENLYACKQTNFDTHLRYEKLDQWAKFADFETRIRDVIIQRQALDRIMIGWNGASAAAETDPVVNPLREDVNIGWLEKIRTYSAGARVLDEGTTEVGLIIIDPAGAGDYFNIDALVLDLTHNAMPSWARGDAELVCILGEDLQHDTYFPLINADRDPTEKMAADLLISGKRIGGKKGAAVPFFPAGSLLVTRLDNLSIYEQDGKRRRTVVDRAELDQVETYESSNDAYVIENFDFVALAENIQFGPTPL